MKFRVGPISSQADILDVWNDAFLDSIRAENTPPPLAARNLAILSLAVFDAANSVDTASSSPKSPEKSRGGQSGGLVNPVPDGQSGGDGGAGPIDPDPDAPGGDPNPKDGLSPEVIKRFEVIDPIDGREIRSEASQKAPQ